MKTKTDFRILVIDDNPAIHQDFIKILVSNKAKVISNPDMVEAEKILFDDAISHEPTLPVFEIDSATQGKEGVEKIALAIKENKPYALAFVDIRMPPGWDGIETIKKIWELDQNIQIVICTAYSDYTWEETVAELGQRDNLLILKKPFDNISVRQLACALTKKWQLIQDAKAYTSTLEDRIKSRTELLDKSLSLMRATLESSADGILVISNDGSINDFNHQIVDMCGIPTNDLKQYNCSQLIGFVTENIINSDDISRALSKTKLNPEVIITGKIEFKDKRIFEYYTQPYTFENKIIGRVWSFHNITERAHLEEELQYQATHDQLTGLPNRVMLQEKMNEAIRNADQNKTQFGVLYIDLDRFKLINDSFTHEAGDKVLRIVSKRLLSVIRKNDVLVRMGGDEFIIIVNDMRNEDDLAAFCRKIQSFFKEAVDLLGHNIVLTTSIGVSIYPRDAKTVDMLLKNADIAMYKSKELGPNQFQFYTEEINRKSKEKLRQETELRRAIINKEFILHYQPQFDLNTNQLVSVEALIRWNHPEKGILPPIEFIPLAEETGLIMPIGEWVIHEACSQVKAWQSKGLPPIRVAVNITAKQFRLYNLVQTISQVLKSTGLEAKYLELELTENIIVSNIDIAHTINDIKKLGVQIALDDFGMVCLHMNYLKDIPIDRLKIDQSYVKNIDSNRGDDLIIQAIITMAKSLNLDVLAEGVETQKQVDFLKSNECGEVQGFYFSKPLTPDECEKLLKQSSD